VADDPGRAAGAGPRQWRLAALKCTMWGDIAVIRPGSSRSLGAAGSAHPAMRPRPLTGEQRRALVTTPNRYPTSTASGSIRGRTHSRAVDRGEVLADRSSKACAPTGTRPGGALRLPAQGARRPPPRIYAAHADAALVHPRRHRAIDPWMSSERTSRARTAHRRTAYLAGRRHG
jgi:hypothetical protein